MFNIGLIFKNGNRFSGDERVTILAAVSISAYSFMVVDLKKAAKFSAALGIFALSAAFFGVENFLGLGERGVDLVKHLFVYAGMIFSAVFGRLPFQPLS